MKRLSISIFTIALIGWASLTTSCTNQDALFANGMIPNSQGMSTSVDSTLTVKSSILHLDSITTSNNGGAVFLGSVWNPIVGKSTSQVFTNYIPLGLVIPEGDYLFGKDAKADSMYMSLVFDNCKGDTSYQLKISVHEIKDTILRSSQSYYSNFAAEQYYDPQSLTEFTISGGAQNKKHHLPRSLFDKLLINSTNPKDNPYFSDELFLKTFKGLYFKVENPATPPAQGAMYRLNLKSSSIHLHYHNANPSPDTTSQPFKFYVSGSPTVNFYTVTNDFTLSDPSRGGIDISQINDSTIQVPTLYVTGMLGLGGRIVIDTTHLNNMVQKAVDAGYRRIAVHRAAIRWHLNAPTPENYLWAPTRMGLYFNFNKTEAVPDYDPAREAYAAQIQQYFLSDIGGSLNRSNGYYEQVITSTIQRLINKNPNVSNIVQLLPTMSEAVSYGYATIGGSISTTNHPTVVIVYTMIR